MSNQSTRSTDVTDSTAAPASTSTPAPRRTPLRVVLLIGLAVCALLAGGLSLFASSHPDGLEFVAEKLGFGDSATEHGAADSPLADYALRGVGSEPLSGALAGLIGVVVVALVAFGLMWLLRRRTPPARDGG
jgi:cobalt/nickel transport system permease protein/cobalt/nickel transport protein